MRIHGIVVDDSVDLTFVLPVLGHFETSPDIRQHGPPKLAMYVFFAELKLKLAIFASSRTSEEERQLSRVTFYKLFADSLHRQSNNPTDFSDTARPLSRPASPSPSSQDEIRAGTLAGRPREVSWVWSPAKAGSLSNGWSRFSCIMPIYGRN